MYWEVSSENSIPNARMPAATKRAARLRRHPFTYPTENGGKTSPLAISYETTHGDRDAIDTVAL